MAEKDKNMSSPENRGGGGYENFKVPDDFLAEREIKGKTPVSEGGFEVVEEVNNKETNFEIKEISEEDIKDIKEQIIKDRENGGLEGLGGSQAVELENILNRTKEENRAEGETPKAGAEKPELTSKDLEKFKVGKEEDIKEATKAIKAKGEKEGWSEDQTKKEIDSEEKWIEVVQASYLEKILESQKTEKEVGVEEKKWMRMADELKDSIRGKRWNKVIPRAGQMNNLDPEKFNDLARALFDSDDKENLLKEIEKMMRGKEEAGHKANPLMLASDIRYVSECFPDLKNKIKLSGRDWKTMERYLKELREKNHGTKDLTDLSRNHEYWRVAHMEKNMKILDKMKESGEIKVSE